MKVGNISIIIFCHETEDKNKIMASLVNFFGDIINSSEIKEKSVEGHYGNKIEIIEYDVSGKIANELANKLFSSLEYADLIFLISSLDERLEGSKLHLRVDKQGLIANNKITLKDGDDVIKIIIGFKGKVSNELKEELKKIASRTMHS